MGDLLTCADCGAKIRGFTGLQELRNLQKHMERKHKISCDINRALTIRIEYENGRKYLDKAAANA